MHIPPEEEEERRRRRAVISAPIPVDSHGLHVWRNGAVKYFYRTFKSLNPGINHRAALLAPGTLAVIRIIRLKKKHGSFQNGTRTPAESGKRRPRAAARRAVEI